MTFLDNWQTTSLNSGLTKLLLLSFGVRISSDLLEETSRDEQVSKSHYYYDASNDLDLCKKYRLPSEILLPNDVESSFYINKHSPLEIIKNRSNKLELYYFDTKISDLEFNKKPDFFDYTFKDGTSGYQYGSMYGRYILGLFLSGYCDYPAKGVGCRFCSIRSTREDLGKQNILSLPVQKLAELTKNMSRKDQKRIKYVMYTAGTYPDVDRGIHVQAQRIKIVSENLPASVNHHLTTMPPKTFSVIKVLKEVGLQTLAYDIEVYNKQLFNYYCPGKETLYGREKMFEAIKEGVQVFGHSNLKVGFVGGLEPISSMKEGMEKFASVGAGISINVFHPDTQTEMETSNRPTLEYLLDMVRIQRDLYKKHNLVPVFPNGGRRSSLDTEVYRGFFDTI